MNSLVIFLLQVVGDGQLRASLVQLPHIKTLVFFQAAVDCVWLESFGSCPKQQKDKKKESAMIWKGWNL